MKLFYIQRIQTFFKGANWRVIESREWGGIFDNICGHGRWRVEDAAIACGHNRVEFPATAVPTCACRCRKCTWQWCQSATEPRRWVKHKEPCLKSIYSIWCLNREHKYFFLFKLIFYNDVSFMIIVGETKFYYEFKFVSYFALISTGWTTRLQLWRFLFQLWIRRSWHDWLHWNALIISSFLSVVVFVNCIKHHNTPLVYGHLSDSHVWQSASPTYFRYSSTLTTFDLTRRTRQRMLIVFHSLLNFMFDCNSICYLDYFTKLQQLPR